MSIHDLIFTNFRRKLFSLMLAILIWMTIYFADKQHRVGTGSPQKSHTNAVTLP